MKKSLISVLAMLLVASCQINELAPEYMPSDNYLYASIESLAPTKTVMDENKNLLWSEEDQLVAFMKTTLGVKYQIKEQYVGTSMGGFSKVSEPESGDDFESGQMIDHNVVLYPHSTSVWCLKNDSNTPTQSYKLNVVLPETQLYEENSFGIGAFPMIAVSTDKTLTFRNICGGIKLQFKGVAKIKSIKFEGLGGEKISGKSTVVGYVDGSAPTIAMASNDKSFGHVILDCGDGVQLSETTPTTFIIAVPPMEFASGMKITLTDTDGLSRTLTNPSANTIKRSCLIRFPVITYEPSGTEDLEGIDLSENGTANSYIVSASGSYKFRTVKGNSSESVGEVASAEVLWESFGTDVTPSVGDLVRNILYSDGYISFLTAETFKEGNAVIAAKDASGTILWSWHIWLTDQPEEQVYYNNAGTMMDRNLGATSATPGDVGTLGLLYQWGRKDPFLSSSSISGNSNTVARSTITWPSAVSTDPDNGTIEYATANPTTYITGNDFNYDWYYTGDSSTDDTRWVSSSNSKSIYDPCPAGWRVPDGGDNGIWSKALASSSLFDYTYNSAYAGMDFSGKFGNASTIWYPASGVRDFFDGWLYVVGGMGYYWSTTPHNYVAKLLFFNSFDDLGQVAPSSHTYRANGQSVRCIKEGTFPSAPSEQTVNLSQSGTANSYIVSSAGLYKFRTVKGNSSESVGEVASAEVLWESFGTDVTPSVGDLVRNVLYSDGYISFLTAETFKEGNAVIAAKDASGTILWSWHIWLTDQPEEQVYYNNAGTMMDRNLGATSANPGDVGALGLLYQWGRKDPFLGSSSISGTVEAKSTITWPNVVSSNMDTGTVEFAIANPATFISYNTNNKDWHYVGDSSLWTTSDESKSVYDPCPAGWRVPDGGIPGDGDGVWATAVGATYYATVSGTKIENCMIFSKLGAGVLYPLSGRRNYNDGRLIDVGLRGRYWSASVSNGSYGSSSPYIFEFGTGSGNVASTGYRSVACSVRCLQE